MNSPLKGDSPLKNPMSQEGSRRSSLTLTPPSHPRHSITASKGEGGKDLFPPAALLTDTDTEEVTSEMVSHVTVTSQDTRYAW